MRTTHACPQTKTIVKKQTKITNTESYSEAPNIANKSASLPEQKNMPKLFHSRRQKFDFFVIKQNFQQPLAEFNTQDIALRESLDTIKGSLNKDLNNLNASSMAKFPTSMLRLRKNDAERLLLKYLLH